MKSIAIATALLCGVVVVAGAHVAPSVDDNNRYIKLTPQADRVRLSYTIFFGEVPGAGMRPSIDANKDKTIDDAEASAFGAKISAEVTDSIDVTVDGRTIKVGWDTIAVGMGTPAVTAGTFSVDLVAYLCLGDAHGKHTVSLRDRFKLLRPGETEIRVEDVPGVTIDKAHVGATDDPSHDYRFAGPAGPLTDDGFDLEFTAGDQAPSGGGVCKGANAAAGSSKLVPIVIGIGIAAALAAGFLMYRRRAGT